MQEVNDVRLEQSHMLEYMARDRGVRVTKSMILMDSPLNCMYKMVLEVEQNIVKDEIMGEVARLEGACTKAI